MLLKTGLNLSLGEVMKVNAEASQLLYETKKNVNAVWRLIQQGRSKQEEVQLNALHTMSHDVTSPNLTYFDFFTQPSTLPHLYLDYTDQSRRVGIREVTQDRSRECLMVTELQVATVRTCSNFSTRDNVSIGAWNQTVNVAWSLSAFLLQATYIRWLSMYNNWAGTIYSIYKYILLGKH